MRPPLAGRRHAARRLGAELRRRLAPVERALPVKLPWVGSGRAAVTSGVPPEPHERDREREPASQAAAASTPPPASGPTPTTPAASAPPAGREPTPPAPADAAARIDAARERLRATIEPPAADG